jgi:cytidylate kinase
MSVITISRGSFSGGTLLAEELAKILGYRCINREAVVEKAAAAHVSPSDLRAALYNAPKFWERLENKKYLYLTLIKAALAEEVRAGKVVYHGHAGHLLLSGCPILRVRMIAPLEYRISQARERQKLSRDQAIAHIHGMDEERKKWARYLYGIDWEDPSLYDLVVNLDHIDGKEASEMIADVAKRPRWSELDARCQAVLDDFARASCITASIVTNPKTEGLELEVECEGGAVQVSGKLFETGRIEEVKRIAMQVPGVISVDFRI